MKNKKILTGFLALTLTTAGYLITGCDQKPGDGDVFETTYSVTYEVFGGTNDSQNPTSYKASDATFSLKDASKTGYEFGGWYKESSFETLVTAIEKGDKGHLKLYAKFTPIEYTVTYNLNGGVVNGNNPEVYNVGSQNITIQNPTRVGYTFAGWRSDFDDNVIVHRRILTGSTGNKTYTAEWSLTDHAITVESEHGTVEVKGSANYNESVSFEIIPDTGYEISVIKINGVDHDPNVRAFTMKDESAEIEVIYNLILYSITYEGLEGATNHADNPDSYTYDSARIYIENPTKPGYRFVGWKETEQGQAVARPMIEKNSIGDKVYIAEWSVNNYLINQINEHGTLEIANSAQYGETVEFDVVADNGYVISAIKINGEYVDLETREFVMGDCEATIEIEYDAIEYDVTYELNGGSHEGNPDKYTVESPLNLLDATKEGYAFVGWYVDEEFTTPYQYNEDDLKNIVLYARFAQARINGECYELYKDAIENAEENDVVDILVDIEIDETLLINKNITIRGEQLTISASESFVGTQLIEITSGNVTLEGLTIDANNKARNIKVSGGHLSLVDTIVTNGHVENSYVSGVYVTGKATFSMDGGKIVNNTIGTRYDYLDFATDLWIGSQASGTVGEITGDAEVGSVFINANSYQSDGNGVFTLVDGSIENVYVEYDDASEKYATFNYEGGVVNTLRVSKATTKTYKTITNPSLGTYIGGEEQ